MPLLMLLLLTWSSLVFRPVPAPADAIVGHWLTPDKSGLIQIYAVAGGTYAGKIVGPATPTRLDDHNPDPVLRRRSLLGVVILQSFHYDDGAWKDGTIYDPKNGKTYSCTLRLASANALEVRGYVGLSLFGRTETWTRNP